MRKNLAALLRSTLPPAAVVCVLFCATSSARPAFFPSPVIVDSQTSAATRASKTLFEAAAAGGRLRDLQGLDTDRAALDRDDDGDYRHALPARRALAVAVTRRTPPVYLSGAPGRQAGHGVAPDLGVVLR